MRRDPLTPRVTHQSYSKSPPSILFNPMALISYKLIPYNHNFPSPHVITLSLIPLPTPSARRKQGFISSKAASALSPFNICVCCCHLNCLVQWLILFVHTSHQTLVQCWTCTAIAKFQDLQYFSHLMSFGFVIWSKIFQL